MKKKITASVVAFALALALPAAAFAVEKSVEASPVAPGSAWQQATVNGAEVQKVMISGATDDVTVQTGVTTAQGIASVQESLVEKTADLSKAERDAALEKFQGTPVLDKYGAPTGEREGGYVQAFEGKVKEITDGITDPASPYYNASHLDTMVLKGDVKEGGTATVEIYLQNKPAQGKTQQVTLVILHETQAPQYLTVTVGADGIITIPGLTEFSYIDAWITPRAEATALTDIASAPSAPSAPADADAVPGDGTDNGAANASDNADKVTDEGATPAGKSPKTGF